jgi:dihydrofolate reductase
MRKVTLSVASTLDNYIARPDGAFDWIFHDQDYGLKDFFSGMDVALIGRKTHDLMVQMGTPNFAGMKNYVFSRTKTGRGEGGVEFVSEDPRTLVDKLKAQTGKDIWLAGGGELTLAFLQAQAVDEIVLAVHPILLGEGIPLFAGQFPQTNLRLTKCKEYSTGLLHLTYEVVRQVD